MKLFRKTSTQTAKPVRLAILMPWGRVGSNLVMSMLTDSFVSRHTQLINEPLNRIKGADDQSAWMHEFYAASASELKLVGSKHAWHAFADEQRMAAEMEALGLSLVRMRRDNIVKVAVSQVRAELYAAQQKAENGSPAWGVRRGKPALGSVALDPGKFVEALALSARAHTGLANFRPDCPIYDIEYEAIRANPNQVFAGILDWLAIEPDRAAEPSFDKATPDDLASAVPNLEELRTAASDAGLREHDAMFDR